MPISHKHKAIFVHIPKTGGVSIEKHLNIEYSVSNLLWSGGFSININKRWHALQHLPAFGIEQLYPNTFKEYFKFSIVRNPYERAVSEYLWCIQGNRIKEASLPEYDMVSGFSMWLKTSYLMHPRQDRQSSQVYFLYNEGKLMVDKVYKLENFETDMLDLKQRLGLEFDTSTKHNVAKYEVDRNLLLSYQNKKLIYKKFKEDFDTFGYQE